MDSCICVFFYESNSFESCWKFYQWYFHCNVGLVHGPQRKIHTHLQWQWHTCLWNTKRTFHVPIQDRFKNDKWRYKVALQSTISVSLRWKMGKCRQEYETSPKLSNERNEIYTFWTIISPGKNMRLSQTTNVYEPWSYRFGTPNASIFFSRWFDIGRWLYILIRCFWWKHK